MSEPGQGRGRVSEAGLGLWDVDLDAVGALRGRVLPHRGGALGRHQPLASLLPLLVHGRVDAALLPRRQLGLGLLLWHGRRELLVVVLQGQREVETRDESQQLSILYKFVSFILKFFVIYCV